MKLPSILLFGVLCVVRLHALESADVAAVAKRFDQPVADEQYQARMELNRLVAQATLPGKGDHSAVTQVLVSVLKSPETSGEAAKYLMRSLARVGTADAVDPLVEFLAGGNAMLAEEAREALSWIPGPKAVTALESALKSSADKGKKRGLIEALATRKSEASVPVIASFLVDPDIDVSRDAMDALARIGGAQAVTALAAAHAGDKVAAALKPDAARALLAASSGDVKIAAGIYQSTASAPVRLAAFIALMKNGPADGRPALIEGALKSEDSSLRRAALARGIETGLPSLQSSLAGSIGQMPKEDRLIVLSNIHHLTPAETAEKIALSRMDSTEQDERVAAIGALGKIGTKGAFNAVLQALGEREPGVNQAASNALASTTFPAARSCLLAMLKSGPGNDKILAIKALTSVHLPDAGLILIEIAKGGDADASREAMKTLYFIATIDDLRVLAAAAAGTTDTELHKSLVAISSRIAGRFNTDEARDLVKTLK